MNQTWAQLEASPLPPVARLTLLIILKECRSASEVLPAGGAQRHPLAPSDNDLVEAISIKGEIPIAAP